MAQHAGSDVTETDDSPGDWGIPPAYDLRFREALSALEDLTERELQVFALLSLGLSNREMAKELQITERTVKAHVCRALDKLRLNGRCEAAVVSFIWRSRAKVPAQAVPGDHLFGRPPGISAN